jgi:hypothetical protein
MKPRIHHLIISFPLVIFSSSHALSVNMSDPYAITHTAARANTPLIQSIQSNKNSLNHPDCDTSRSPGGDTTSVSRKQLSRLSETPPPL